MTNPVEKKSSSGFWNVMSSKTSLLGNLPYFFWFWGLVLKDSKQYGWIGETYIIFLVILKIIYLNDIFGWSILNFDQASHNYINPVWLVSDFTNTVSVSKCNQCGIFLGVRIFLNSFLNESNVKCSEILTLINFIRSSL